MFELRKPDLFVTPLDVRRIEWLASFLVVWSHVDCVEAPDERRVSVPVGPDRLQMSIRRKRGKRVAPFAILVLYADHSTIIGHGSTPSHALLVARRQSLIHLGRWLELPDLS